ncbi:MAG TPA: hypothetical protein V6D18_17675 [Thermosynechococcaceae cyanobacterium]
MRNIKGNDNKIQRDPLKYLRQVEAGVSFVITLEDHPIAELKPIL